MSNNKLPKNVEEPLGIKMMREYRKRISDDLKQFIKPWMVEPKQIVSDKWKAVERFFSRHINKVDSNK